MIPHWCLCLVPHMVGGYSVPQHVHSLIHLTTWRNFQAQRWREKIDLQVGSQGEIMQVTSTLDKHRKIHNEPVLSAWTRDLFETLIIFGILIWKWGPRFLHILIPISPRCCAAVNSPKGLLPCGMCELALWSPCGSVNSWRLWSQRQTLHTFIWVVSLLRENSAHMGTI